ncbi:Tigger transposable element-derived protein 7-like 29, partial [Homarus americanus]
AFREKLNELIQSAKLEQFQLYSADETGLFWKAVPMNTQAEKKSSSQPDRKLNKHSVSALFCANADGSHRLKPGLVGKSRQPRVLEDVLHKLPVYYYNNPSAWFTRNICLDWFLKTTRAWKNMKQSTLQNCWKKLLKDEEVEFDFEGFENDDFRARLRRAGEHQVCSNDISEWLEADDGDPGYQILSEAEIAASVQNQDDDEELEDEDNDDDDWIDHII